MKILITGVAGFIGSNLADRLLAWDPACDVVGLDDLSSGVKEQIPSGVQFHKIDIRSKDIYPFFEGVDFVFHLAAKNCISDCQRDPLLTAEVNILGTVNVLEACRQSKVKKIIFAESSALYEGCDNLPSPEESVDPQSFYAVSKLPSFYFARSYARFYGLRFSALRYFNVYGPRQDYRRTVPPLMSGVIIRLLSQKKPLIYGNGKKRRDFVHVDDVNAFHLLCLTDERTDGRVFNIGSGEHVSVLEITRMIRDIMGASDEPVFEPDLPGEAQATLADISAARVLGWEPKTSLKQGLETMVDYVKQEIQEGRIAL